MDGKHYYSTRPENHGKKVMVGIRAHYIDILNPDGSVLVRHARQYGDTRTDTMDYGTSLDMLAKNSGAWQNSGFRKDVPELIRGYIDSQSRTERRSSIRLMADLAKQYGTETAVKAMETAINTGSVNRSDAAVLAARIHGYGLNTEPEPGPSLSIYDKAFLPNNTAEEVKCP